MSDREEVIAICANGQKFLAPEALEYILSNDKPIELIHTVLKHLVAGKMFIDKQDVIDTIVGDVSEEPLKTIAPKNKHVSELTIYKDTDVTGNSTSTGKVEDFAKYIKSRYVSLSRIIEAHPSFGKATTIEQSKRHDRDDIKIIGIVYSCKETKNGHKMIQIEDLSGMGNVMILKSSPLISETIVDDEVIGFTGRWNTEKTLFIVKRITRPDIPKNPKWEPTDTSSKLLCLSDIHIGSDTFLQKDWDRMIEWLKHDDEVQYIILPGDVVDGIGVYPGQDKELYIKDIYEQYDALGEHLKEIPDGIKMVLHPGNHDACRIAEPQPALASVFTKSFDSSITLTSNPVFMDIEGRTIATYHGKGMDDWVKYKGLSYDRPNDIMKNMLVRRHFSPMYGAKNALVPEPKDYLVMERVPDILITGHIHKASLGMYNGVRMVNASTFQSQTEYQKMHNFIPSPGRVPIVSLADGDISLIDFHKG